MRVVWDEMVVDLMGRRFFQRSDAGLFIDMISFLAFGRDFVEWNYQKSGNPVYLNIKQSKKPAPEDRPLKKPTLLAIGTLSFPVLFSIPLILFAF